ncbi:hypothetical protein ASE75_10900 [Sphingomonas sp. Leaf17]|uniref:DUF3857 domain-containing protein n=1 Tax=Sphingomonas sp. Leaf17 TaxID=1735683 RepID=UPI0006F4CBF4|nr:DUF3857 domain-containing protein [Sphingomonas sp. Leaf17]KQM63622.1 hypothetical protein ASE75_10900 [Sphingomonas sp. Leaf17]
MKSYRLALGVAMVAIAGAANAGDMPLYQAVPAWVKPAPAIDPAKAEAPDAPPFLIFDSQQRIEGDHVWQYVDSARRVSTQQMLEQMGTLALPWQPDKGDLMIHRAEIVRGAERIDLLKTGGRFTVLRREQGLEQRSLDGVLTATMAVEGLRVGDVLRLSFSTNQADAALKGRAQSYVPLMTQPLAVGFGRSRILWPAATPVHVQNLMDGTKPAPVAREAEREVTLTLPLEKAKDLPGDAPLRYRQFPMLEASTFADWADVSRTMAPLFAAKGLIADGSPLAAEVAAIAKASADPLMRTQGALQLVQSKIRYLALGMNGGNYVPQTPASTWTLRYGDCKAKTLLLLAILDRLGIEGEAVLVSAQGGDSLPKRLPAPGVFDHVIVRATVAGRTLWLDGTGTGARAADIGDTPGFRHVLPLRVAGADLMPLPIHADARPMMTVAVEYDDSAGIGLPTLYKARFAMRGAWADQVNAGVAQADAKTRREMASAMATQMIGEGQIGDTGFAYDPVTGIATVTVAGIMTTRWEREDKRYRQTIDMAVSKTTFAPDRARPAWADIPVATEGPGSIVYATRLTLPDGGKGFVLEGDRTLPPTLAGALLTRKADLTGAVATAEDRIDSVGAEIRPADVAAARAAFAQAQARILRVVAPVTYPPRWRVAQAAQTSGGVKAIDAMFARAIADDPKEVTGYASRASFHAGIYDYRGAAADMDQVIAIQPDITAYMNRARYRDMLGNGAGALADAQAAVALDPSSQWAVAVLANLKSDRGDAAGALALAQERIDAGGKTKADYLQLKADVQAAAGDVPGALATIDAAIAERPGMPGLLNGRCWIKGTRNVALDTALKDCTKAIELSDSTTAALDSRAMVYFRMNRMADALSDLDAVLENDPNTAASLFLRGVVRKRTGDAAGSAADLMAARIINPQVDRVYARYGITA